MTHLMSPKGGKKKNKIKFQVLADVIGKLFHMQSSKSRVCLLLRPAFSKATVETKQSSILFESLLKWVRKLADFICGKISPHYFMFTETAVSMAVD